MREIPTTSIVGLDYETYLIMNEFGFYVCCTCKTIYMYICAFCGWRVRDVRERIHSCNVPGRHGHLLNLWNMSEDDDEGFVEGEFDNVDDYELNDFWISIMDTKIVYIRL